MLGIHDFPKVLIQSGGSHLQHANLVSVVHSYARSFSSKSSGIPYDFELDERAYE